MRKLITSVALAMVMGAALGTAASASADTTQIDGVTISSGDIAQLRGSLIIALKPNDMTIPIVVTWRSWDEMPPYEPEWHYDGLHDVGDVWWQQPPPVKRGEKVMSIWINDALLQNRNEAATAVEEAILLALADGGYGGSAFKQLYVIYAAKDAALFSHTVDPFLNRRKLAAALMSLVGSQPVSWPGGNSSRDALRSKIDAKEVLADDRCAKKRGGCVLR
ncbi:MAG TPA: hypothetical protein VKR56_01315 [Candidatus Cybelea sp.]|nr:hypothetical protein [Candidatus Cybelea sp.]